MTDDALFENSVTEGKQFLEGVSGMSERVFERGGRGAQEGLERRLKRREGSEVAKGY